MMDTTKSNRCGATIGVRACEATLPSIRVDVIATVVDMVIVKGSTNRRIVTYTAIVDVAMAMGMAVALVDMAVVMSDIAMVSTMELDKDRVMLMKIIMALL